MHSHFFLSFVLLVFFFWQVLQQSIATIKISLGLVGELVSYDGIRYTAQRLQHIIPSGILVFSGSAKEAFWFTATGHVLRFPLLQGWQLLTAMMRIPGSVGALFYKHFHYFPITPLESGPALSQRLFEELLVTVTWDTTTLDLPVMLGGGALKIERQSDQRLDSCLDCCV